MRCAARCCRTWHNAQKRRGAGENAPSAPSLRVGELIERRKNMRRCRIGFVLTKTLAKELFSQETVDFLASFADFNALSKLPDRITPEYMLEALADADVAVTCWHTPAFTDEMLERLPKLRLVAHAAGSIKNLVPKSFWPAHHQQRAGSRGGRGADDARAYPVGAQTHVGNGKPHAQRRLEA